MKKNKQPVPVQKGKIDPNPMTMKQLTHTQRLAERSEEIKGIRKGQHTDLHTPRKGRG